jgi:hypothetical protein
MFANVTEKFGCIDCKYFTNSKAHIYQHNKTKKHIEQMKPKILDPDCKYQCLICFRKHNTYQSKLNHSRVCFPVKEEAKSEIAVLQEQISNMAKKLDEIGKNQQVTNITNNNNNNTINNNINIFLNEKCCNAINMFDFVQSIGFCRDNYEAGNLLLATALEHTASIFQEHLNKITLNERPVHSFIGEDQHQMIAHYRHNNEWKIQSEISLLDESHRDFDGKDPQDTFMYYLSMFHKNRRSYFDKYFGGKRNHVSPNLNFTTNSQEQYDLSKRILQIVAITPDKLLEINI